MQLSIFVSGKWSDKESVHKKIIELKEMGCHVTHDWTQVEQSNHDSKAMGEYAQFDINGVKNSAVHVILMEDPKYAYRGTYTELGVSLALGKRVILMCPFNYPNDSAYCQTNVFYHHPQIEHVQTWEEVKELVQKNLDVYQKLEFKTESQNPIEDLVDTHKKKRRLAQAQEIPKDNSFKLVNGVYEYFHTGC